MLSSRKPPSAINRSISSRRHWSATNLAIDVFSWPIAALSFEMTTAFTPERTVGWPPSTGPPIQGRRESSNFEAAARTKAARRAPNTFAGPHRRVTGAKPRRSAACRSRRCVQRILPQHGKGQRTCIGKIANILLATSWSQRRPQSHTNITRRSMGYFLSGTDMR
jgi:hypothetical protein